MTAELVFSVAEFIAVFNQTINFAFPYVTIQGELANFRVSKGRWVYFDLKDDEASVKFFGTVYQLPGPLEEGMVIKVSGNPQLHAQYGFSVTIQNIQLAGEGTIKKAAQLLQAKLQKEGLFDQDRKRLLPHPPATIGLITSGESAAYADFTKIIKARWGNVEILLYDVQVQGENAPAQIIEAIEYFNAHADMPEVLVITRGGGSADDLQAFSSESVTRAVAASRIPTLVAIGHEVDISLAEMAADLNASTPSNAAELLVPDKTQVRRQLTQSAAQLTQALAAPVSQARYHLNQSRKDLIEQIGRIIQNSQNQLKGQKQLLEAFNPQTILRRGYSIIRSNGQIVRSAKLLQPNMAVQLQLSDGTKKARIE